MPSFNPNRLELARRRRGLTKVELAGIAEISVRSLVAYEAGRAEPEPFNLARLASKLRFPIEFFAGPDLEEPPVDGTSFRALSTLTARHRDQSLGAGTIAMHISDWIESKFTLPVVAVPQYQSVDPETAAIGVRTEWGL